MALVSANDNWHTKYLWESWVFWDSKSKRPTASLEKLRRDWKHYIKQKVFLPKHPLKKVIQQTHQHIDIWGALYIHISKTIDAVFQEANKPQKYLHLERFLSWIWNMTPYNLVDATWCCRWLRAQGCFYWLSQKLTIAQWAQMARRVEWMWNCDRKAQCPHETLRFDSHIWCATPLFAPKSQESKKKNFFFCLYTLSNAFILCSFVHPLLTEGDLVLPFM